MANINIGAFLEGFTGGSLFFEAKHPGIPDRLFVPDEEEEASAEVSAHLRTVGVGQDRVAKGFINPKIEGTDRVVDRETELHDTRKA